MSDKTCGFAWNKDTDEYCHGHICQLSVPHAGDHLCGCGRGHAKTEDPNKPCRLVRHGWTKRSLPCTHQPSERTFTAEGWAAQAADWGQVVQNGGPPCFRLMADGRFCLRAERWPGHVEADHLFVSLADLLTAAHEREAALREENVMRLAAVSTASIQNTRKSLLDRIPPENPYYSTAYADTCRAVEREIRERERAETAESALAEAQRERDEAEESTRHMQDRLQRAVDGATADRQKVRLLRNRIMEMLEVVEDLPEPESHEAVEEKLNEVLGLMDALGLTAAQPPQDAEPAT